MGLPTPCHLGIECGGTRSVALLVPVDGGPYQRAEFGPANLRLLDDRALVNHFKAINGVLAGKSAALAGIAIGMAGARTEADRRRILAAAAKVWPKTPVHATHDLETALMAAGSPEVQRNAARVLVLSGTGSCCYGQTASGKNLRVGGWGHILGDNGSGYEIGLRALRTVAARLDRDGKWPELGANILCALQLNEPDELIGWVKNAEKAEVAALATVVFDAAAKGDRIARELLKAAAASLAAAGIDCARRLVKNGASVEFVLAGGNLLKQAAFARQVTARLRILRPGSRITPLQRESAWGAVELARKYSGDVNTREIPMMAKAEMLPDLPASPTEQRNSRSRNLDRLPLAKAVALMIGEESKVAPAILKEKRNIARAIEMIARSFRRGGRLFYAGAGTSGRLGILDASECPPTFRVPPEMVQGIIAGGQTAIWRSVEGAEDDATAGAAAVAYRGVRRGDVVVGIAASGRTPFVWGALGAAKKRGARTILLSFNPHLKIPAALRPNLVIAPDTGPEVLTGSTRLKAGTATKIVLNTLTTLAMARLGKVMGNLMVDLNPSNAKLRDRAVRIVQTIASANAATARAALEKTKWNVKRACRSLAGGY